MIEQTQNSLISNVIETNNAGHIGRSNCGLFNDNIWLDGVVVNNLRLETNESLVPRVLDSSRILNSLMRTKRQRRKRNETTDYEFTFGKLRSDVAFASVGKGNEAFTRSTSFSTNRNDNNDDDANDDYANDCDDGSFARDRIDITRRDVEHLGPIRVNDSIVPPYEYASVPMMLSASRGKSLIDSYTEKGGTLKHILQSNKSYLHYLNTFPLKNTFRGYIQLAQYMRGTAIGLPRHHATALFGFDEFRDRLVITYKPKKSDCSYWPGDEFDCCVNVPLNFGIILKRDPCIHNGSVVNISTIYVCRESECNDSIHVSPYILENLNADFDGDTVTCMICRGIESSIELRECMSGTFLFGGKLRFTCTQSMTFRIFSRLLGLNDRASISNSGFALNSRETINMRYICSNPVLAKMFLFHQLDYENNESAAVRAVAVFDTWTPVYKRATSKRYKKLRRNVREILQNCHSNNGDSAFQSETANSWSNESIWDFNVLNAMMRIAATSEMGRNCASETSKLHATTFVNERHFDSGDVFRTWLLHILASNNDNDVEFMEPVPYSLTNWKIAHSGAKSSPRELRVLNERTESSRSTSSSPRSNFFSRCADSRIDTYVNYLDTFVHVSKNVPKSSYFASGLKWVTQLCDIRNGDLVMNGEVILPNVIRYIPNEYKHQQLEQ